MEKRTFEQTQKGVLEWAEAKGILEKSDSESQFLKLVEEVGELANALGKGSKEGISDAIGDTIIVLTILARLEGLDVHDCYSEAYDVIKSRTGEMVNGIFVKDGE